MHPRWSSSLIAGVSSFVVLGGVFVWTILLHYRALDLACLWFAAVRVVAISLLVAAATLACARQLRSLHAAAMFGAVGGLAGAVAYIALVG